MGVICCGRDNKQSIKQTSRGRYGSLGSGGSGKYDDSDDEGSSLYSNNLLMDDDDEEEEQIVIITNAKKDQAQKRTAAQPKIDNSVFKEGKGLLDMPSPARNQPSYNFVSPQRTNDAPQVDRVKSQMEQDRAVNDVMNEIDDHLEDSDEDTAYLVNANSGTGESQVKKS